MKKISCLLLFLLMVSSVFSQRKSDIDSLERSLNTTFGNKRIDLFNTLAYKYMRISLGKTVEYAYLGLQLAQQTQYRHGESEALQNLGYANTLLQNYDIASDYLKNSLKINRTLLDSVAVAKSVSLIGFLYLQQGNTDEAYSQYIEAQQIIKGNIDSLAFVPYFVGNYYLTIKDYDEALKYLLVAIETQKKYQKIENQLLTYYALAEVYEQKNEIKEALDYLDKAKNIAESAHFENEIAFTLYNIGKDFCSLGSYSKSIEFLNNGLKKAVQNDNKVQIGDCYRYLSETYSKLKDYEKAYNYFRQYIHLKDSLFNEQNTNRVDKLSISYETEKQQELLAREKEIRQLESEKQEAQQLRQKMVNYFFLVFAAFLLITVILIVSRLTYQKKVEEKLRLSEKKLQDMNTTKDKILSIIGHDLKGTFWNFKLMLDNFSDELFSFDEKQMKEILYSLKESSNATYNLLDNLLNWAKIQRGQITYRPKLLKLDTLIKENMEILNPNAKSKEINLCAEIDENIEVYADKDMINIVIRNLISNAIKFTTKGGEVKISSIKENTFVNISILDSGVGIDSQNFPKLFKAGEHLSTFGTNNEKGSGLGLVLCKEFIEYNGGKIWVESELNKGSRFNFSLPLRKGSMV